MRRFPQWPTLQDTVVYSALGSLTGGIVYYVGSLQQAFPHQAVSTLAVGALAYYYFTSQSRARRDEERIKEHYRFLVDFRKTRTTAWQSLGMWYNGSGAMPKEEYQDRMVTWMIGFKQTAHGQMSKEAEKEVTEQFRAVSLLIQHFGMAIEQGWLRHDTGFDHFYCHWRVLLIPVCEAMESKYQELIGCVEEQEKQVPQDPNTKRIIDYDKSISGKFKCIDRFTEACNPIVINAKK